jgi:cytoskeleton protein RodZ
MTSSAKKRPLLKEVTPEAQAAGEIEVGYSGIGSDLRAARLRMGIDLAEVADRLNLKRSHLEAIEQGRFSALPGPAYASGFLRSFANFVGMDGEAALKRFRDEVEAPKPAPLIFPVPTPEGRMPSTRTVLLALLAAGAIYFFWSGADKNDGAPKPPLVADVPERLAPLAKSEAPPIVPAPAPVAEKVAPPPPPAQIAEPVKIEPPAVEPVAATPPPVGAPIVTSAPAAPPPPAPAAAAEPEAEAPPAKLYGATNVDGRVLIVARMDSWIQVRGKDRDLVFSRTLRAGDSFRAPNREGLGLMTGNAGGLEIVVDGKPIPPLGAVGAVKRDISLDPERLIRGERND